MKRFLWLMCIGCCSATFAVGCGDDDGGGGGGIEDGGVTIDDRVDELSDTLTGLEGDLGDLDSRLTDSLADLNTQLEGANGDISGLTGDVTDLQGRIEDLITPDNCTDEEICVPNGVQATAAALAALMTTVCEKEFDCCDENERAARLGTAVEDVGDCVKHIVDALENGQSPDLDLFGYFANGILDSAVQIAIAINSNDVQVGIDAAKIMECDEQLQDIDCNGEEEEEEPAEFCETVDYEEEEDPCMPEAIAIGLQDEGELCGVTGIDECADGLKCRAQTLYTAAPPGAPGICMPPAAVGDGCDEDADCDGTEQYCDHETGSCEERADEGEDCEYIDPSFLITNEGLDPAINWGTWLQNLGAMKIPCKTGLSCDPDEHVCVNNCEEHTICETNWHCPEDTICNFTAIAALKDIWGLGFCTDPLEEGDPCTFNPGGALGNGEYLSTECDTERCADIGGDDGPECLAQRTEDGGDCDDVAAPTTDNTCASTWCNGNDECASLCDAHDDCGDDEYCNMNVTVLTRHPCEPKGDTGDTCTYMTVLGDPGTHVECDSGRCAAGLCADKLANAAVCLNHGDCPSGSFCGYNSVVPQSECMTFVAEGGNCLAPDAGDWGCGPDAYCGNAGTNNGLCADVVGVGDSCDLNRLPNDVRCDEDGDDNVGESADDIDCIAVDVDEFECHGYDDRPNGAGCEVNDQCESEFCNTMLLSWVCEDPIEGGEDCDADEPDSWYCEPGYYCKHDPDAEDDDIGKGECTRQRSVGQSCEPRYDLYGDGYDNDNDDDDVELNVHDCQGENDANYYSNNCALIGDEFLCNNGSREDEIMCDGED